MYVHLLENVFSSMDIVIDHVHMCIYSDVDVRNSIGIAFSHCVGCLIVMHTIPHTCR